MDFERALPANLDAERFILGSILLCGNETFAGCEAVLSPDDFSLESHRRIYTAMKDLESAGLTIGRVELANELIKRSQLESIGGLGYLSDLDTGIPQLSSIDSYISIVREKSTLRQICYAAQSLMNRAMSAQDDPGDIIGSADTILSQLTQRSASQAEWQNPGQVIDNYPGGLKALITPTRGGSGIQLPWPQVNTMLCGLQPGDLALVAGRPSHGKSIVGMQLAYEAAKVGRGVAYFSLEMTRESLVHRLISMVSRVDSQRMRLGYLNADERREVSLAHSEIESVPLWIDANGYTTPAIRSALKKLRAQREVSMVVLDHFHLLASIGREEERQKFNRCADDLMRYAKEFGVPFVVLAQLNRKCEEENRAPQLSDLSETGKLEQNAGVVNFIYRPEMYGKNRGKLELRGHAEFIVAKQRNGPTGKIDMQFMRETQRFEEVAYERQEAA